MSEQGNQTVEKKVKLGDRVIYVSSSGDQKLAFVTATPDTITAGTDLPSLEEGQVHLQVFPPAGHHYPRLTVPSETLAASIPDYAAGESLTNVWRHID